jgi:hypothetical protein
MTNTDEACCWYPESQELHVNLLSVIGIHSTLIMGSWNHRSGGINLSLVTDDGIEHYDPFNAPYFQISDFLNVCAAKPYLDQILAEVMQMLKSYRADSFGMLMLLSQHQYLTKFCGNYSTLFWLLFRQAKAERWNTAQFLNVCSQGESAMLLACHLPANPIALELLAKITANNFAQHQYDWIQRLFTALDCTNLNAIRADLPDHLIQFLLRHPELQHMKLIQHLEQSDYHELLRTTRAIQRLADEQKIDTVNVTKQVLESDSIPALKSLENRLSAANASRLLHDYEKMLGSATGASNCFPSPPLADSKNIVAITSASELLAESKALKHDLITFAEGICAGNYYAYKILKPERGTLLLYLFKSADGGIMPVIKSVITYSGQEADITTIKQINEWIKQTA